MIRSLTTLCVCLTFVPVARAGFIDLPEEVVLLGVSVGYLNDGASGGLLGLELSYVHTDGGPVYIGGYFDARYDWTNQGSMLSLGGEIFWAFFGVDAGLVVRTGRGGHGAGFRVRGCASIVGVVSVCGGGGFESVNGGFGEFSAMVKAPFEL